MYECYRIERRRFQRISVKLSVLYQIDGPEHIRRILADREYEGEAIDLSEGGIALIANHFLPRGVRLSMRLILFESTQIGITNIYDPLSIEGDVRSCFYRGEGQYRLGICFNGIGEFSRTVLTDLIYSSLKPACAS